MIGLLARMFIKDGDALEQPRVRRAYGSLCCLVGVALNLLLFGGKYLAGVLSSSIAITVDAFNNLSDAVSSLVTWLGFRLGSKKPDQSHPFGHGRLEYVSGLIVSFLILLMGLELLRSSIRQIIAPEPLDCSPLALIILALSLLVKLYMFLYNRRFGRKLDSAAMKATAMDSLADAAATMVVLLSLVIYNTSGVNVDGWAGVLVSLFILWAGVSAARDTIGPLLGRPTSPKLKARIESIVLSHAEVLGLHDLLVHDYGPGCLMISLHVEVAGAGDLFALHEVADHIEQELYHELGAEAVIHLDPVASDHGETEHIRQELALLLRRELDERITIHDLRLAPGSRPGQRALFFDALLPFDRKEDDQETASRIRQLVGERWPGYECVVKIDHPYS